MGFESVPGTGRRGKIGGTSVRGYQRWREPSAPRRGRGLQYVHGTRSTNPTTVLGFLGAVAVVAFVVPAILVIAAHTSDHRSDTAPTSVHSDRPAGVFPHSPPPPAPPPPPCYPLQVGC